MAIQIRRGTAAALTAENATYLAGQPVFETDTRMLKVLDGATAWTGAGYVLGAPAGSDTQLQVNHAGVLGGDAALVFNFSSKLLKVKTITGALATLSVTSNACTPTVTDAMDYDVSNGANLTINSITGTAPTERRKMMICVKNTGGSTITITLGTGYRSSADVPVPSVEPGKKCYLGFVYDPTDAKWDLVGTPGASPNGF